VNGATIAAVPAPARHSPTRLAPPTSDDDRRVDLAILIVWGVFWVGWLVSAFGAKPTVRRRGRPVALLIIVVGAVVIRALGAGGPNGLTIHDPGVRAIGAALVVCGLGLAVWARVMLGRNWGMPMTEKDQPELVTSGPYRFVRHPIYSGIVLATAGTALAVSLGWLVVAGVICVYFGYSAVMEERILTEQFPEAYPPYQERTKMLIPFLV
jgi:protein-S-isoprenylcysteine O-methyltransferase Ste14